MSQRPEPAPFFLEGGPVGALLIHGFTGSPPEMRLLGDYLHEQGLTVSGPLLPGHGETIEAMNEHQWTDWAAHVEQSWGEIHQRCETVFVGGLSMGSLLAVDLTVKHPEVQGVMLYSPALKIADRSIYLTPLLKHFVKAKPKSRKTDLTDPEAPRRTWSYRSWPLPAGHELLKLIWHVEEILPLLTRPLLVIHSTQDRIIRPNSAAYAYELANATDKNLLTLHNSGHVLTVDSEWRAVAEATFDFIQSHRPEEASSKEA